MSRLALEEAVIAGGDVEATVLPGVGARLHRLRAFGHDLLRTPDDPGQHIDAPFDWGAFVMAPWCNRIEAEPHRVGSRTVQVPANFPDGSAIHGQVHSSPWNRSGDGAFNVTGGGDGWPWRYRVGMRIEAADSELRIVQTLTNLSEDPMPGGLGLHPWFRRPLLVAVDADRVHPSNTATDPLPEPVSGSFDLRRMGPMAPDLDATWPSTSGEPVEIRWPDIGIRAQMRIQAVGTHFVVAASPADRDATAIEPQTHAPHGLRRLLAGQPGALALIGPGEDLALGITVAFERLDASDGARNLDPERRADPLL